MLLNRHCKNFEFFRFALALLFWLQPLLIIDSRASNTIPEVIYYHKTADPSLSDENVVNQLVSQIEKRPGQPDNYIRLARLVLQMGLENTACDTLDKMERECHGSFMREFRRSLDGDELFAQEFLMYAQQKYYAHPEVQYYTAKALREHNFLDKAKDLLDKLIAKGTYVKGAYSLAADIALQEQRWSDAFKFANLELKHNHGDQNAMQYRLWSMNKLGILSDSESVALKQTYDGNPARTDIGVLYGDYLVRNRRSQEALNPLLYGITATSDDRMQQLAESDLSRVFSQQSDTQIDSAFYAFLRLQNPDVLMKSLLQLRVARVLITTGRYALARRYLTESLNTSTYFAAGAYKDLARTAELQGLENDAQQFYEKAFSIDPNDKATWLQYQRFKSAMERKRQRQRGSSRDLAGRLKSTLQWDAIIRKNEARKPTIVEWQWR